MVPRFNLGTRVWRLCLQLLYLFPGHSLSQASVFLIGNRIGKEVSIASKMRTLQNKNFGQGRYLHLTKIFFYIRNIGEIKLSSIYQSFGVNYYLSPVIFSRKPSTFSSTVTAPWLLEGGRFIFSALAAP